MFIINVFVVFKGNEPDKGSEQKVSQITITFQLDGETLTVSDWEGYPYASLKITTFHFTKLDETSRCHARLVHKLLSQYFEEQSDWLEMYPTRGYVPKVCTNVDVLSFALIVEICCF